MASKILEKAQEMKEELTKIRRHLHQHPELGLREVETTSLIKEELESIGIELVPLQMETGALAIIRGEKDGAETVTALRADIDALPIVERTGLPYASVNEGVMHACGHDGHMAVLLGVAKLLKSLKHEFSGTMKLIFQPAEEIFRGANRMCEAGVLENPRVDTIVALHGWPGVEVGKIGVFHGTYMASADRFNIKVIGSGGHGGYPHRSIDSVLAAAEMVVAFQKIVSREIDALDSVVVSVCTIHGGQAFNVIPEEVSLSGTVRCLNESVRDTVEGRMNRILEGVGSEFGCQYELEYTREVPALVNDPEALNLIIHAAHECLGERSVVELDGPAMGSEDFSIFLNNVPHGAYFRLGLGRAGAEQMKMHNDRFDFNDDALPYGLAVLTQFVLMKNQ